MNIFWYLYAGDVVAGLMALAAVVTALSIPPLLIMTNVYMASEDDKERQATLARIIKRISCVVIGVTLLAFFAPSKQTLYLTMGLHATQEVVNTISDSEVGQKSLRVLNKFLDEQLKDFSDTPKQ